MKQDKIFFETTSQPRDPDMIAAENAMKRAAEKARLRAQQNGSCIAIWQEGKVIEKQPNCDRSL